jgi:hypothetical protein
VATISNVCTPWPVSTTASTRSPFTVLTIAGRPGVRLRGRQMRD